MPDCAELLRSRRSQRYGRDETELDSLLVPSGGAGLLLETRGRCGGVVANRFTARLWGWGQERWVRRPSECSATFLRSILVMRIACTVMSGRAVSKVCVCGHVEEQASPVHELIFILIACAHGAERSAERREGVGRVCLR